MANTCFYCDEKKETAFPAVKICIGKFREIKFCKKSEIKEFKSRNSIAKNVDSEVLLVFNCKDTLPIIEQNLFDEEEETTSSSNLDAHNYCSGFKEDSCSEECGDSTPGLLHAKSGGKIFYFCKAAHLIRWLVKYHTGNAKGRTKK